MLDIKYYGIVPSKRMQNDPNHMYALPGNSIMENRPKTYT